jgi:hypothetical protein
MNESTGLSTTVDPVLLGYLSKIGYSMQASFGSAYTSADGKGGDG